MQDLEFINLAKKIFKEEESVCRIEKFTENKCFY